MELGKFALSIWTQASSNSKSRVGKRFALDADGKLVKGEVSLWATEMTVDTFDDLEELTEIIDKEEARSSFFTSGVPENWEEIALSDDPLRVTTKNASARAKRDSVQRTKVSLPGQPNVGTYFVVDFDTAGCPWEEIPEIRDVHSRLVAAALLGGLNLSEVQCIGYRSSSSSLVREADGHEFDKGGRHLVFLVQDASDYDRFRRSLDVLLTLTGSSFGRIGKAGQFLKRGVLDIVAARLCQPTFMVPPVCGAGLRSERDLVFLGGSAISIDSRNLRDPTPEELESYNAFWAKERARLLPESKLREAEWRERKRDEICEHASKEIRPEVIEELLDRRLCGHLLAPDIVLFDDNQVVTVGEILSDTAAYDGMTCADPIEPDLRNGRNKAICYANLDTGQPIIFSHCGGGTSYRLLHDTKSILSRLDSESEADRFSVLLREMKLLYTKSASEAEASMKSIAKAVGTTKKAIVRDFGTTLAKIRNHQKRIVDEIEDSSGGPIVDSPEYLAAAEIRREKHVVSTHGARGPELWSYSNTHWRPYYDGEASRDLLKVLSREGWVSYQGRISRAAQDAVLSLKQQSFELRPAFRKPVGTVINCSNGELWFDLVGDVELRPHSADSGLTYVLEVDYDPEAASPILRGALNDMFLPPSDQRESASEIEAKSFCDDAAAMVDYMLEILAYTLVPSRWLAAWFLFIGNGSNGKTLLMKVLQRLLPEEAVVNERLRAIAENSFGMARLRDKTVLIDDDLDTNFTLPDGFLKKVSEAKRLSANVKHNPNDVSFDNRCAIVLLSNNFPRIIDISFGTLRRIHVVNFPRQFYTMQQLSIMPSARRKMFSDDVADVALLDKLEDDLPGVLNELVAAYSRLRKRGGFEVPTPAQKATNRAICMAHPLKQFIEEHCAIGDDRYSWRTDFQYKLNYYNNVDQMNNWSPTPQQVRNEMEQLGFPVRQKNVDGEVREAYIGLSLKDRPNVQVASESLKLSRAVSQNRRRPPRGGDSQ